MLFPNEIELNDIGFRLYAEPGVDSFREYAEPKQQSDPDVAGSSRPSKNARPDILLRRQDNWSGGEGDVFFDRSSDQSARMYYYSDGPVDVLTPGRIKLGLNTTQSKSAIATITAGGHLVKTKFAAANPRNLGLFVNGNLWTMAALDTWTDRGNIAATAGNTVYGPPRTHFGKCWVAMADGSGGASTSRIRTVIWDGAVLTTATYAGSNPNRQSPLPTDGHIYVLADVGGNLKLESAALTGATALTSPVHAVNDQAYVAGADTLGHLVYYLASDLSEEPEVYIWDGATGKGRVKMPEGFRTDTSPIMNARFLGDLLYVAGWQMALDGTEDGVLSYVAPGRSGTVGVVREDLPSPLDVPRLGCVFPSVGNRLLAAAYTAGRGQVFLYDTSPGTAGLSQYISVAVSGSEIISSIEYVDGMYFFAVRDQPIGTSGNVRVLRTLRPGTTGYHPSSVQVISSWDDFGYREERKLLHRLTVETGPLPANTRVRFQLEDEAGNIIKTDRLGADLIHDQPGTTTKTFELSGLNQEADPIARTAKLVRVNMILENQNGATDRSPSVESWTLEATMSGFAYFYDVVLSLEDMQANDRLLDKQVSGEQQAQVIRDIIRFRGANPQVVKYHPRYAEGSDRLGVPPGGFTEWPIPVEVVDFDLRLKDKGNGFVRLKMRELIR